MPLLEVGIILALMLANGVFAASEIALVSVRKTRLEASAAAGSRRARQALDLAERPGTFLATVQIGITLIGTVASIFAGESLVGYIEPALAPLLGSAATGVSYVLVVVVITFFSLVLGELAPKRIALRNPEALATRVAPLMTLLSRVASALVWLLERTTDLLLRLFGIRGEPPEHVTEEDVRALVGQATSGGSLEQQEGILIDRVLRFNDRRVREIMTPRLELRMLDLAQDRQAVLRAAVTGGLPRYPAHRANPENVVGVVHRDDLLEVALDQDVQLEAKLRRPLFVPENAWAHDVLMQLHDRKHEEALVVDEHGSLAGMVTADELVSELVGVFGDDEAEADRLKRREDGSYLVDGSLAVHDLREVLRLPEGEDEGFSTVAGFVIEHLGRLPATGDLVEVENWRLEVVDMDGNRVDKVLVVPPRGTLPAGPRS